MPMMLAVAAALLSFQAAPAASTARIVAPIDQCGQDEGFARFRSELLDVLVRRDATRLRALVAPDIEYSFGGDAGRDSFFRDWKLNDPASSALWTTLAETLMLGCARQGGEMIAPYAFLNWPEFDSVGTSYLARPGAELHRRPSDESEVIDSLAWHVVEDAPVGSDASENVWRRVRLGDGRIGYVRNDQLRIDIDYRAVFQQRSGSWLMTTFIAGD